MKKILLAALIAPLFSFVLLSDWVVYKIDNNVTVSYPATPNKENESFVYDGDGYKMMTYIFSYKALSVDSAVMHESFDTKDGIKTFGESVVAEMDNSKLLDYTKNKKGVKPYYQYKIKLDEGYDYSVMYLRVYFTGKNMYGLYFYETAPKYDDIRDKFFKSFTFKY